MKHFLLCLGVIDRNTSFDGKNVFGSYVSVLLLLV